MIKRISHYAKNKESLKLLSVLVDQAFMSVTTILTAIVLARTYDKSNYADLVLLFSITIFTLGFQSGLISKPYAISQNDFKAHEASHYYQFNLRLKFLFTLAVALLFPLFYYVTFKNWDAALFLAFLLYVVSNTSYFFVRETLLSERKTILNLYYGIACSICLITLLGFIYYFKLLNVFIFLITASCVYLLLVSVYLFRNFRVASKYKINYKTFWKANWKLGKWLVGSNVLFHISSNIYPWLLLYITTKDDIAVFGVLVSISGLVNPILTALGSYLLPIFVQLNSNYENIKATVKKWNILFGLMAIVLIVLGYFLGQTIIVLFFGDKYANLGLLVVYPFIYQAINIFFQPFKIALNAIKRTDVNFWILIPRSIIAVTLGYFLTRRFGLYGVFYTMIIENLIYQLLYFIIYTRIINSSNFNLK